jgi:hypothetical protein
MDSRFDDLLHTVIVEKGQGIYGFFDVVFGFMYRRTDFFYEMAPGENMGFFPGQAEAIVYNYMKKYQNIHYKEKVPKRNIDPKEVEEFIKNQREKSQAKDPKKVIENAISNDEKTDEKIKVNITNTPKEIISTETKNNTTTTNISSTQPLNVDSNSNVKQIKPIPISTYNGDQCDNYGWSQGVMDVTIQVKLPEAVPKKQLSVKLTTSHLSISRINKSEPYFEAEFCEKIKPDDSNWTIEEGTHIVFFLEKAQEVIWKSAFKGHKEIDTKKVDNSKKIDEFDTETQAALNKIVYEQSRKRNGLPTTEEEKKLNSMKEAWNAPDSPFRGQPFDPSMFNLNEPIYYNTPEYEATQRAKAEREKENNK